jgi:hypothetical protein
MLGWPKKSSMSGSGVNSEDRKLREVQTVKTAHRVSSRSGDFLGNWTKDHSCYILTKNLCAFYSVLRL